MKQGKLYDLLIEIASKEEPFSKDLLKKYPAIGVSDKKIEKHPNIIKDSYNPDVWRSGHYVYSIFLSPQHLQTETYIPQEDQKQIETYVLSSIATIRNVISWYTLERVQGAFLGMFGGEIKEVLDTSVYTRGVTDKSHNPDFRLVTSVDKVHPVTKRELSDMFDYFKEENLSV